MTDIILAVGVATFLVYTGFNIAYLQSMRRTSEDVSRLVGSMERNLTSALGALAGALENVRKISGNVNGVAEDLRQISHSAASIEKSVRDTLHHVTAGLSGATQAHIAGLKAGISTGVVTLVKNLKTERRDGHEGGT